MIRERKCEMKMLSPCVAMVLPIAFSISGFCGPVCSVGPIADNLNFTTTAGTKSCSNRVHSLETIITF